MRYVLIYDEDGNLIGWNSGEGIRIPYGGVEVTKDEYIANGGVVRETVEAGNNEALDPLISALID